MYCLFLTACSPLNGTTLTFPEIENDDIRDKFYYSVSQDCMSIQACLDVNLEDISITKTFSAFVELDPCHYEIRIGIERWKKTYYLIDYKWGEYYLNCSRDIQRPGIYSKINMKQPSRHNIKLLVNYKDTVKSCQ